MASDLLGLTNWPSAHPPRMIFSLGENVAAELPGRLRKLVWFVYRAACLSGVSQSNRVSLRSAGRHVQCPLCYGPNANFGEGRGPTAHASA